MIPLAAISGIPSLVKGVAGLFQMGAARRRAKANVRPVAQVNENYLKNVAIAENMGRVGLPQQQYNRGIQNIARNQASAFTTLSRSSNPSAGIQGLLRASNDATLGLDVQDANTRLNNQRFAFGQRGNLAQEQERVWNWNRRDKFREEATAAGQEMAVGQANSFGALDNLSSLAQTAIAAENGDSSGQDMSGNRQGSNGFISTYKPNATVNTPYFGRFSDYGQYGRFNPQRGF